MLARLRELLPFAPGAEVTVEANPETVDQAVAEGLAGAGATRVSMGAQSFDDRVLAALGRVHDAGRVAGAVAALRAAGVPAVNLDLIYGGPGEDAASWSATLAAAVALAPSTCRPTPSRSSPRPSSAAWSPPAAWPSPPRTTWPTATRSPAPPWPPPATPTTRCPTGPGRPRQPPQPHLLAAGALPRPGRGAHEFDGTVRRWNVDGVPAYLEAVRERRRPTAGEERLDPGQARFEALAPLRTVAGLGPDEARALASTPPAPPPGSCGGPASLPRTGPAADREGMFLHGEVVARLA